MPNGWATMGPLTAGTLLCPLVLWAEQLGAAGQGENHSDCFWANSTLWEPGRMPVVIIYLCASSDVPLTRLHWASLMDPSPAVRAASVLIVLWRRHTHSWTPSWRNWDVFHSFRARKTLCVTVNLQSRWQWGEMFWLLVHHWNGCMWSRPSWTTEDAATIRPNSLRHKPRWTRHPVLNWLWQVCNDCTHAGDRRARIMWESMSTPKNFVHWRGSRTLFCWFVRSPRICRWSSTKSRCVSAWSWDWANIGQSSK